MVMGPAPSTKRIGELLVERGVITRTQLDEALIQQRSSKEFLGAILVRVGAITEQALLETLSQRYGIPHEPLDLARVDWNLAGRFPDAVLTEGKGFPIRADDATVMVAIVNPLDAWTLSAFQRSAGARIVKPVLVLERELQAVLREHKQQRLRAIAARLNGHGSGKTQ